MITACILKFIVVLGNQVTSVVHMNHLDILDSGGSKKTRHVLDSILCEAVANEEYLQLSIRRIRKRVNRRLGRSGTIDVGIVLKDTVAVAVAVQGDILHEITCCDIYDLIVVILGIRADLTSNLTVLDRCGIAVERGGDYSHEFIRKACRAIDCSIVPHIRTDSTVVLATVDDIHCGIDLSDDTCDITVSHVTGNGKCHISVVDA